MKGLVEEMVYLIIIILAIFMLFVFFIYQQGTKGVEVEKSVEERILMEEGNSLAFVLFNNKLAYAEKFYLECGIDAILQGSSSNKEMNKVFYGVGIGKVNLTEIIPPLLDNYAKGRWKLEIITPDGTFAYGELKENKVIYSYEMLIPVPEERVGKIILLLT